MPEDESVPPVTDGRALTTDRDREQIAQVGDVTDSGHYQAVSRVRRRIGENLAEDVELLKEHHEELLKELREVVCEE
jgi:transcriptional regulator of met regulon